MCSVDETANDEMIAQSEEFKRNRINGISDGSCSKCDARGPLVYHGKDFICQSCFVTYCTHKFRSTIGKAHKVKHGDKILVAFSGGQASTAMLHMILQGLSDSSHKKIKFHPSLLYVHETGNNHSDEVKEIIQSMIQSGLPCYISSLDMYFKDLLDESILYEELTPERQEIPVRFLTSEKLNSAISSLPNLSSKDDYIKQLRLRLLTDVAKKLMFNHVFVGDTSSLLAVEMLSGIALGRGSQIPNYVGFADNRYPVSVLRPLREFQMRDISLYNHYSKLSSVVLPTFSTMIDVKGSIKKLTETFINGLQEDFPATIPTIFRTGDKICSSILDTSVDRDVCVLCMSSMGVSKHDKYTALDALSISQQLSQASGKPSANTGSCENCVCKKESFDKGYHLRKWMSELCYPCHCLIREANDFSFLPSHVVADFEKRIGRRAMKNTIEEFLCSDEEL